MLSKSKAKELSAFGLLLLVIGQVLPQLDFAIVNVALEVIGQSLHASETGLILIVALYGLSFAALITTGGRLGDRYGRKRLFMIGIVGFCVASTICGCATGIITMLIGRALQGLFGALLLPQILATIHATLEGDRHRYAVGIYTSIAGLSAIVGQVAGGWLVSANLWQLGWRVAFFINIPICLIIFVLGMIAIPETKSSCSQPSTDTKGIVLFILCLLFLLMPVSLGNRWPLLWCLLIGTLPCAYLLWKVEGAQERAGCKPLLPPSLLRTPMVLNGLVCEITVTFSFPGYLFVTALYLQSVIKFSPLESGNTFIVLGAMFFIGSLISKPLGQRYGDPLAFLLGSLLTASGFVATIVLLHLFGHDIRCYDLWIATGIIGFGNAFMLTSAYRLALSQVGKQHASEVSSVLATVQQASFALGTAVTGAVYSFTLSQGYLSAITTAISTLSLLVLCVSGCMYIKMKTAR